VGVPVQMDQLEGLQQDLNQAADDVPVGSFNGVSKLISRYGPVVKLGSVGLGQGKRELTRGNETPPAARGNNCRVWEEWYDVSGYLTHVEKTV
jgi:hypothetical protein